MQKGTKFLMNGISIPEDANSTECIAGKPLSEWHVGANMFSSMGCDHHGYQNIGYMVICLSNIAIMHFSCKALDIPIPPELYHHAKDLWEVVKACTFADGRLLRIGGDTRARYCYCQDYAIPMWLWARDYLGDHDVTAFEEGWMEQVNTEVQANADGRFLSTRLAQLESVSPLYYVRLEGDRACTLSMGAYWQKRYGANWQADEQASKSTALQTLPITLWSSKFHGRCLVRGKRRIASWTWRAAAAPQGLCIPAQASSMAEWQHNLAGRVLGMGRINTPTFEVGQCETYPGGFTTCGKITITSHEHVAEGESEAAVAVIDLACVALPDDRTVIILQRARALGRPYLREVKGLFLQVGNDIFNHSSRIIAWNGATRVLKSLPKSSETIDILGDWLCVDDQLSVVRGYGPALSIHRPADRQIGLVTHGLLQKSDAGGNLYAEEICCGCSTRIYAPEPDAVLFDIGVVIMSGTTADESAAYARQTPPSPVTFEHPDLRGISVTDATGTTHTIIANFADIRLEANGMSIEPNAVARTQTSEK
jgi:hypothetical protein